MVYLSQVSLNPQSRATGRATADLYALHQLVYSAFTGIEPGNVGRVLFRLDADPGRAGAVLHLLVQSEREPDWSALESRAGCIRGPKEWLPRFETGQRLRFRLRASPTKRMAFPRGHPKAGHQRIGLLTRLEQAQWLQRQGERCGFRLCDTPTGWFDAFDGAEPSGAVQITSLGHLKGYKPNPETGRATPLTHLAVDFDGLLQVTDAQALAQTIVAGIGPGKGFGFGLLSLARHG
jgi:CRISPR system Cascade subunit CasE